MGGFGNVTTTKRTFPAVSIVLTSQFVPSNKTLSFSSLRDGSATA
jgi:hypothetical protein